MRKTYVVCHLSLQRLLPSVGNHASPTSRQRLDDICKYQILQARRCKLTVNSRQAERFDRSGKISDGFPNNQVKERWYLWAGGVDNRRSVVIGT